MNPDRLRLDGASKMIRCRVNELLIGLVGALMPRISRLAVSNFDPAEHRGLGPMVIPMTRREKELAQLMARGQRGR